MKKERLSWLAGLVVAALVTACSSTNAGLTSKIKTKLAADHPGSAKHISVDTDRDGIVWMTGTANSQEEVNQAVAIAKNTEGVKMVKSDLKVQKDR